MSDKNNSVNEKATPMPWVITCGDEGVQINHGRRLAFLGAGLRLEGFTEALAALHKTLASYSSDFDTNLRLAASEENAYIKETFALNDFDEANASMQQHAQALADREKLLYAGILPFADPLELEHEIKGHMVRPKGIHIANKICLTVAGGETTYNLGRYLISADWLAFADEKLAKQVLTAQIAFYEKLSKKPLPIVIEEEGDLAPELVEKNMAMLAKIGLHAS
jgi:hypothetical protein